MMTDEQNIVKRSVDNSRILERYNESDAADRLAHSIIEISRSSEKLIRMKDDIIFFCEEGNAEKLKDIIHEFREELRYLSFHIKDDPYLNVINESF